MSEDQKPGQAGRPQIKVASVDGSKAVDHGESIKVGFTTAEGAQADAVMTPENATDLMLLLGNALGEARRQKLNDPNTQYIWPVHSWRIEPQEDGQALILWLRLISGNDLCVRFDQSGALNLLEGLSATLGLTPNSTIPDSQKN